MRPYKEGKPTVVLLFLLTQSTICTQSLEGKGEIHKRVENRRLSTLLCPRRVGGPPLTKRNYLKTRNRIYKEKTL